MWEYAMKRASEEKDREDAWKDEGKTVEDVAFRLKHARPAHPRV